MRIFTAFLGFTLFSLFTYWQLNDAKQYGTQQVICFFWIGSYATLALLSLICAFKQLSPKLFWILAAIPFLIAIFRFFYIDWSYDNVLYNPDNPAANETGGLLVMAIWALVLRKINAKCGFG